jgi:hypothetical protein
MFEIYTPLTVLRDEHLKNVRVYCKEYLEDKNTLYEANEGFTV